MRVRSADLKDGLLIIDLVREIPEAMRPRRNEIGGNVHPIEVAQKRLETAEDQKAGKSCQAPAAAAAGTLAALSRICEQMWRSFNGCLRSL